MQSWKELSVSFHLPTLKCKSGPGSTSRAAFKSQKSKKQGTFLKIRNALLLYGANQVVAQTADSEAEEVLAEP